MTPRYRGEPDFQHGRVAATGILLTNVGTPDAPDRKALKRYLRQFLSDPRVVEKQGLLWKLILHGIILRTRPQRSAELYRKIWTREGSPLLCFARRLAIGIETNLRACFGNPLHVDVGMGYGSPSISKSLTNLREQNCRRLLVLPLYPQYAAATVGSSFDAVTRTLQGWRWLPEVRFVTHYHDEPAYIQALAASVRELWTSDGEPQKLLMSFHGLPQSAFLAGDPYHCHCHKTARLLAEELHLSADRWSLAFQSRFGKEPWLQPYTDDTLREWGRSGVKSVDVICPGFALDCLETLEEIGQENRGYFESAGGEQFRYIPALNDRPLHVEALAAVARRHLTDGLIPAGEWDADLTHAEAERTRRRAEELRARGLNT